MKIGKRYRAATEAIGAEPLADVNEAVERLKRTTTAKFDETVEVSMRLGVDPRVAPAPSAGSSVSGMSAST